MKLDIVDSHGPAYKRLRTAFGAARLTISDPDLRERIRTLSAWFDSSHELTVPIMREAKALGRARQETVKAAHDATDDFSARLRELEDAAFTRLAAPEK